MEMIVLSNVNELCIYARASSSQFRLRLRTNFTHADILLSCVSETVSAWKHAFFQDSCQSFYGPGQLTLCQCYLKMHVVGEGPGASL